MTSSVTGLRDGPAPRTGKAARHDPRAVPAIAGAAVILCCGCWGPLVLCRSRPPRTPIATPGNRSPFKACRSAGSRPAMPSVGGTGWLLPPSACRHVPAATAPRRRGPSAPTGPGRCRAMTWIGRRTAKRPAPHRVTRMDRQGACRGDADRTGLQSSGQAMATRPQTQQMQSDRGPLCHPRTPQDRQQGMSRLRHQPGHGVPADDVGAEDMVQARWPEPPARDHRGDWVPHRNPPVSSCRLIRCHPFARRSIRCGMVRA